MSRKLANKTKFALFRSFNFKNLHTSNKQFEGELDVENVFLSTGSFTEVDSRVSVPRV